MKSFSIIAIYNLWLREMKRFFRARSQILGSMMQPLLFLAILGVGVGSTMRFRHMPSDTHYLTFLVPGIIGMSLLFRSIFTGFSVLVDRQFGFLKEIMVAPVSRTSIIIGRILGGITTSLTQAMLLLLISFIFGFKLSSILNLFSAFIFMVLISISFTAMGIVFASIIEDMHGFQVIMSFVTMPIFFLSGAMFPLVGIPTWMKVLSYLDPLTYGVDGLRYYLAGNHHFPLLVNFMAMLIFSLLMVGLSSYLFKKCEA